MAVAVGAYVITIMQRTTFGVVGLRATTRFAAGAGVISSFVVIQMLVYALAQVPAGYLADRLGPRAVIGGGALLMALGQVCLATTDSIAVAILGRVLVAIGDACTWTPMSRLIPNWFPSRMVPLVTQSAAIIGATGQVLSAVPFAALVRATGWTPAFLSVAGIGAFSACLVILLVRNHPSGDPRDGRRKVEAPWSQVRTVLREPGTQLGFWGHWLSAAPSLTFIMMWGSPYLEKAQGLGLATIGLLFSVRWAASTASGLMLGYMTGRHPLRRSTMILMASSLAMIAWAIVLLQPGPAPLWLLILLLAGIGAADPGAAVGFDIVRTTNHPSHTGTAIGIVVMGGFIATLIVTGLTGLALDLLGGDLSFNDFRIAMGTIFITHVIGLVFFLHARRRARALETLRFGTVYPTWRQVIERERRRRADGRG